MVTWIGDERCVDRSQATILATLNACAGRLCIRDAIFEDAEQYVSYWHESGDDHLAFLGVSRSRLGSVEETRDRFLSMTGRKAGQPSVVFTLTLRVIGYTNINCHGPYDNYPHLHTYRLPLRAAAQPYADKQSGGLGAALIGSILSTYLDLLPMRRIILQTRTRNRRINRALDCYLPVADTRYFDQPDGVAGPGDFHIRYVFPGDSDWLRRRSRILADGVGHE